MVSISTIFYSHFLGPGYWENCESIYWGGWDTCPVLIWRALQCWCQSNLIISCGIFDLWRKHNDNCLHPEQEGQTPLEWTYNFQNKMTTYKAVTFLWIHTRWGSFLSVCFWVDVFFWFWPAGIFNILLFPDALQLYVTTALLFSLDAKMVWFATINLFFSSIYWDYDN